MVYSASAVSLETPAETAETVEIPVEILVEEPDADPVVEIELTVETLADETVSAPSNETADAE